MSIVEELLQARENMNGVGIAAPFKTRLYSLLRRAASAIKQLEKDNVDARSKCICVFCKAEFSKTDLSGAVEHLCSCDKSPIVQRGRELFAQVEELQAGEKWAASMFCKILVTAISGVADAAVVGDGPFGAEHALGAVNKLVERTKQLQADNVQSQKALRAISDMNGAHISDDGGDMDQDPSCYCARCIAVRALSQP